MRGPAPSCGVQQLSGARPDPRVKAAAVKAVEKMVRLHRSRFLNGTLDLHVELSRLAKFLQNEDCQIFSTASSRTSPSFHP